MKQTHHILKRSYEHPVVVVGDLFLYHLNEDRQTNIINKWLDVIKQLLSETTWLACFFENALVMRQEILVELHLSLDREIMNKQIITFQNEFPNDGFLMILDKVINQQLKKYMSNYLFMTQKINQQLIIEAKRLLLSDIVMDFYHPVFISLHEFDYTMLYQLDKKVLGFIITKKSLSKLDLTIAKAYQIPVIDKRHHMYEINDDAYQNMKYKMTEISVYLPIVDTRHLHDIKTDWYKGIVFHSEYMLITKGLMISEKEVFETFKLLFKTAKDKPIHIEIPNFINDKRLMIDPHLTTEVNQFSMSHVGLQSWINGLIKAINLYKPNLTFIVPNINSAQDIFFWDLEIAVLIENIKEKERIKIGMTIETEAALQYCEDFNAYSMAMIKLDELMMEYDMIPTETPNLKEMSVFIDDLKEAHYMYRVKQPKKHLISGTMLGNKDILRKFINMGFRDFIIPVNALYQLSTVIAEWENTRGRFAKGEDEK